MVWNPESSPLYQSVEKFNSGIPAKPEDSGECHCQKADTPPPLRGKNIAAGENIFRKIRSDPDCVLIISIILLLLHEKADMKLVAALVFVLLA